MRSSLFLELENTWWKRVLLAKLRFFERSSTLRYLFLSVPSIFRLCGKLLSSSRLFPFPLSILPTLPQMLRTWLKARQHRGTRREREGYIWKVVDSNFATHANHFSFSTYHGISLTRGSRFMGFRFMG